MRWSDRRRSPGRPSGGVRGLEVDFDHQVVRQGLERAVQLARGQLVRHVELGRPADSLIAGHAAVEFEFTGEDNGGIPIVGTIAIVDGDGYYHLIGAWSERRSHAGRDSMLRAILMSTRLHFR